MDVIIKNENGEEIAKKVIKITPNTSIVVKLNKDISGQSLNHVTQTIEDGLESGILIVPNWVELTFIEKEIETLRIKDPRF